ncbi:MAG: pyridoxal phosphate-dependent aminotransferase [bacterium]|nr:pyridoxal phosphate-dependent aminotransferase [bacterium]
MPHTSTPFSDRVLNAGESLTVATFARIGEMRRRDPALISLVAGEPDFDTPEHIKEAAIRAIRDGKTKYTSPASGLLELKQAIVDKLLQDNELTFTPPQIVVACGAKQIIFDAVVALINPGDEAIIPAPYWVSYADQVRLMGGTPVIVQTTAESGFKMSANQLKEALTPHTKFLMLNSPCNPTGEVYTRQELQALADVIAEAGIYVISDEIYEKLLYDGAEHVSIAALHPTVAEKSLIVNGVSKAYAMTGWRVGYGAGPQDLMSLIAKVQSQETTNTCTVSQYAALEALTGPQDCVEQMRRAFQQRRDFVVSRLNQVPGITCRNPHGAFYAFPNVSAFFGKGTIQNDFDLFNYLLDNAKVGCVPGSGFGADAYLRFSYAASMEQLEEALGRIERALGQFA